MPIFCVWPVPPFFLRYVTSNVFFAMLWITIVQLSFLLGSFHSETKLPLVSSEEVATCAPSGEFYSGTAGESFVMIYPEILWVPAVFCECCA